MNKLAYKIRIAANTHSLCLLAWQAEPLVMTSNHLTYLNYINEKYLNCNHADGTTTRTTT